MCCTYPSIPFLSTLTSQAMRESYASPNAPHPHSSLPDLREEQNRREKKKLTSSTLNTPPVAGINATSPICVPNVESSSCANC